jgi:hypothetical protein
MGVLSVYASFIILTELNNLIGANEIRQWLSIPGPLLRHNAEDQAEALTSVNDAELQSPRRTASLAAAMILASPAGILNLALLSFIISLGIYLGCSYSADLKPGLGSSGSLGILIFYIVSTLFGLYQYSFPAALKSVESVVFGVIRWQEIKQQERRTKRRGVINNQGSTESLPGARAGTIGITPASAAMHQRGYNGRDGVGLSSPYPVRDQGLLQQMLSSTPPSGPSMDEFREALKSYIEAQEASAQRGRALLDILTRMPQPTSE